MNFIELVKNRKSLRKYSEQIIPRELIDKCLEAARLAPSACNSQPWSFLVIDNKEKVAELTDIAMNGLYQSNQFVKNAPVLIVVMTEKANYKARIGGFFRKIQYSLIDIGIACDHLTLQAEELGIGTCWLGWFDEKKLKKALNLPVSTSIDILISMGYSVTKKSKPKNRRDLSDIRRYYSQ